MSRSALLFLAAFSPALAFAADNGKIDNQCATTNYHQYVEASIEWYENLVSLTIKQEPELEDVANWFLDGRRDHFTFKSEAFDWYLENDNSKLNFEASVESWLKLNQEEVKSISLSDTSIAPMAKKVFEFRQGTAHENNYQLRSALAELLSHPKTIETPLNAYNAAMEKLSATDCKI